MAALKQDHCFVLLLRLTLLYVQNFYGDIFLPLCYCMTLLARVLGCLGNVVLRGGGHTPHV